MAREVTYCCSFDAFHKGNMVEAKYLFQGMCPEDINFRVDRFSADSMISCCADPDHVVPALNWLLTRYRRVSVIRVDI